LKTLQSFRGFSPAIRLAPRRRSGIKPIFPAERVAIPGVESILIFYDIPDELSFMEMRS